MEQSLWCCWPYSKRLTATAPFTFSLFAHPPTTVEPLFGAFSNVDSPFGLVRKTGPVFPFGFEMGFFAVESEGAKLSDPGELSLGIKTPEYTGCQSRSAPMLSSSLLFVLGVLGGGAAYFLCFLPVYSVVWMMCFSRHLNGLFVCPTIGYHCSRLRRIFLSLYAPNRFVSSPSLLCFEV